MLVAAAIAVGTLVLSYVLVRPLGILGPAVAWLAVQSAVALAVLPSIRTMLRSHQDSGFRLRGSQPEVAHEGASRG